MKEVGIAGRKRNKQKSEIESQQRKKKVIENGKPFKGKF